MTSWYQSGYDLYRREPTHGGFRMERVFSVEEIPDPVRAPPPTENGVAASGGGGADVGGGSAGSGVGAMNWCPSEWYEEFRARQQILVRQMEVTAQMVARLNVGIAVEFDRDEEDSSAQSGHAPTRCSAGGSQESEGGIGLDFGSNEEHADEVIDEWPLQDVVWDEEYTLCVSDPSEPQDSHGNIEAIHKSRSQSKKQRSRDGQQDVRAGGAALAGHSGRRVQCRRHCQRQLDGRGHAHLRPQRARHDRHRRRRQGVARRLRVRGRQARDSNAGSTKRRSVRRSLNKALDIWPPSSSDKPRDSVEAILMVFDSLRRRMLQLDEKEDAGKRADLKAGALMMQNNLRINNLKIIGSVPGLEIGDIFFFRIEMCIVGLHAPAMAGIDYMPARHVGKDETLAVRVISPGGYDNDEDDTDTLVYTGQGGNSPHKEKHDQKLERGNLALMNNINKKN